MRIITNGDYSNIGLGKSDLGSLTAHLPDFINQLSLVGSPISEDDEERLLNLCTQIDEAGLGGKIRQFYPFVGLTEESQGLNLTGGSMTFGGVAGSYVLTSQGFEIAAGYSQIERAYADTGIRIDSENFGLMMGIKNLSVLQNVTLAGSVGTHVSEHSKIYFAHNGGGLIQGAVYAQIGFVNVGNSVPLSNLTLTRKLDGTSETVLYSNDSKRIVTTNGSLLLDLPTTTALYIGKYNKPGLVEDSAQVTIQHFGITEYLTEAEVLALNLILEEYNGSRA